MLTLIQNWKGAVEIDGSRFDGVDQVTIGNFTDLSRVSIKLLPKQQTSSIRDGKSVESDEYVITVKQYMTKKASPEFDFMAKWNDDVPMPLRTMVGTKVKETRGMVYMKLHGDIVSTQMQCCMRCGRPITNKVSQYFGMGPECGGHNYINPFNTEAELKEAVDGYKQKLQQITWEGWIIKSAILSETPR